MEYETINKKLVVIVNSKLEIGRAMNAIAHMSLGLGSQIEDKSQLRFKNYKDKDCLIHPSISDIPFIVLKGKASQIKKLKQICIEEDIVHTNFIDTMIGETYVDQHIKTNNTSSEDLTYFGICLFGDVEKINNLTRKFSLWR